MRIPLYQIDAFTGRLFGGNPAAVCPLAEWLPEPTMQSIAAENNLAETAFFVAQGEGYLLRWFTPTVEVELCGHATLASGYVVTHILMPDRRSVRFDTLKAGPLEVTRDGDLLAMDFPAWPPEGNPADPRILAALGKPPAHSFVARGRTLAIYECAEDVAALRPVPTNLVLDTRRQKRDVARRQWAANMAPATTPRRKQMLDMIQQRLDRAVEDNAKEGPYRVARDIFTDPEIFEIEMKHIFEGNWIYLAHESQIPNKNDYFTTYMGRQPIFIARSRAGELNAFINACSHRGAMLCRFKRGSRVIFTCPFHGWTFTNSGKLLKVKNPEGAGYPEYFNKGGSHDLTKVPRFESYRGFLFGSLNPDVVPLVEHLGEAAKMIDLIVDQSPEGLEVLRGASTYVYDGNWKLQTENGADGYHVTSVHWNYAVTTSRRKQAEKPDDIRAMDAGSWAKQGGGFYSFENGHLLLWTNWANPEDRPNWEQRHELVAQFGQARADWMVQRSRNLCLYPNVYLMDQFSSQIRQYRPIAADKTEVTIYCIAPKGESAEARARRIRQYEDFFNASGMATPDDLEEFRACQMSYLGRAGRWNDLSRGAAHWIEGADDAARSIGLKPLMSGMRTEDEGLFVVQHKYWQEVLQRALSAEVNPTA